MLKEMLITSGAWKTILEGLGATCKITLLSLILGTVLGIIICMLRMSRFKPLDWFARLYIAILRGTPVLMLLMMLYYVILAGTPLEADIVAVIAFGMNSAAYIAELMRSGIQATDGGQVNAGRTLGFTKFQAFRYITLPQAAAIAKPVYESTIINLLQWTSVVGYVTITDLTRVINTMSARTMQPVIMITIGIILYLAVAYVVKAIFALTDLRAKHKREAKRDLPPAAEDLFAAAAQKDSDDVIKVRGLCKSFGDLEVLRDVDLDVKRGEVISILGQSGCGKTVFLHCLELLHRPDKGTVVLDGMDITAKGADINMVRRKMGMVYQNYYLFSHLNIIDNMTLAPMKLLKTPKKQAEAKALGLLKLVGLDNKALAMPDSLSGGQKQRIAIARSLMMDPEVIFFDEPTSALDPGMVGEVLATIRMLSKHGLTMMIITHEMNFAREIADRILFFADKGIYEQASPQDFFENPQREKTIAFVRKLKTLTVEIKGDHFDLMELAGQIDYFCEWYGITDRRGYRLRLCAEELVYELMAGIGSTNMDIAMEFSYSDMDKKVAISTRAAGKEFNPFDCPEDDDDAHLGITIIRRIADEYTWKYEDDANLIYIK